MDRLKFHAINIDDDGNEGPRGDLQVIDGDLVLISLGGQTFWWPINFVRRFGCSKSGKMFMFEAGRRCFRGENKYRFLTSNGTKLLEIIDDWIENQPKTWPRYAHREDNNSNPLEGPAPIPLRGPWSDYTEIDFITSKALSETKQSRKR